MAYYKPIVIPPTLVVGAFCFYLRSFYLKSSRAIKRMEGVTKSPVFSHLTSSLQGLTTLRACKAEKILINEFDKQQVSETNT